MHGDKAQLRKFLRSQRRNLSATEVTEKSRLIFAQLQAFAAFHQARTLALYNADENEVTTEAIWHEAVRQGKAVYYPRISTDRADLDFVRRYPGQQLITGAFGILIPPGDELLVRLAATDIVLTPGVGFDRQGHRLGRGKGYYDRAFRGILANALRVALAYEFQVIPDIPSGPTDEPLHYLVTETGVIDCT
jgi:5-formyltetrahydrofolate cyclo-ligase